MTPHITPTHRIDALNGLRGIAALLVVISHFALYNRQELSPAFLPFANQLGFFAVAVFFLISGFVIPITLAKSSPADFLWRRVWRIYPIFFICCILIICFGALINEQWPDAQSIRSLLLTSSLFGGLFLLPKDMTQGIVWTLNIEVKFYLICALVWWLSQARWARFYRIFLVVLVVLFGLTYPLHKPDLNVPWVLDASYAVSALPYMIMGVFVCLRMLGHLSLAQTGLGLIIATAAFFRAPLEIMRSMQALLPSYLLAAGVFAFTLYARAYLRFLSNRVSSFLGLVSYPVYAIHLGIITLVNHYLPLPLMVRFALVITGTLIVAYGLHRWIEQPLIDWSKRKTWHRTTSQNLPTS